MSAYYDRFDYHTFWKDRDYEDQSDKLALRTLLGTIESPRKALLDVGGGYGRNANVYAPLWAKATLLDPSAKNLDQAKASLGNYTNLTFVQGKSEKLPFPADHFDTIVCVRVFHHLPSPQPSISEFARVLAPGGFLVLEVANKIHAKARFTALIKGRWRLLNSRQPFERRSETMIRDHSISFVNHHPAAINRLLRKNGFKIKETLSVSNLRSPLVRLPGLTPLAVFLERILQAPLAKIWFGPSIYFLAQKVREA